MIVKVNRSHGFYVGDKYHAVHPSPNPQFVPDELKDNHSFQFVVKHGDISIIEPAAPAAEEAEESENPETESESEDAAEGTAEETETDEAEVSAEAGAEAPAAAVKPRRSRRSRKVAQE